MKIRHLLIALFLLPFMHCLNAQYNFKKADQWLTENTDKMGGRAILVVYKDGKTVYSSAVNAMNLRQKTFAKLIARRQGKEADIEDYTIHTRQPIASCSKWLSAALVMSFVDEGKLSLEDTVGKFIPVLSQNGKGSITISQCLSHLTAIKAGSLKDNLEEMREINSMDEAMEKIAVLPMEGTPGKVFHYSNIGLQIAGAILEKISGKSFGNLFLERIARPLQMKNTDFGKAKVALPAGGAGSTPEDYINFLIMILNKGMFNGKRILSESSVAAMQVNRLNADVKIAYSPAEAVNFGYGYGEWIMGNQSISSPGLFGSFPWVDNTNGYVAFLMTYYLDNTNRNQRYIDLKKIVDEAVAF